KGNYKVKALKLNKYSNPRVISVKPPVGIVDIDCNKKSGQLKITGSGFGEKPDGTDDYLNVDVDGQTVNVISWTDTEITVSVSYCKGNLSVTVNALFGSATWQ
ncbi:MAG: IPT/TIG domain-containing protein, partial [Thermodesulfovibrionia bacterium]|nr:IPT/TIG domain-containing protein [Thermodesulfovibrionia bacterium]